MINVLNKNQLNNEKYIYLINVFGKNNGTILDKNVVVKYSRVVSFRVQSYNILGDWNRYIERRFLDKKRW